jgi:hypothetical protein
MRLGGFAPMVTNFRNRRRESTDKGARERIGAGLLDGGIMESGERRSGVVTPPWGSHREADLPEDLRELLQAVNLAAIDIRVAEAEHACRIAALASASAGRHTRRGLTATEACARALGVACSTLQAFAALATRWTPEDLRTIFQQGDARGRALSVSQLLLISRLPRGAREQCLQRILAEGLSVRELRKAILRADDAANEQRGSERRVKGKGPRASRMNVSRSLC